MLGTGTRIQSDNFAITDSNAVYWTLNDRFSIFFIGSSHDNASISGFNEKLYGNNNTDLSLTLNPNGGKFTGDYLNFGNIHGTMSISDFHSSDFLVLRNVGYANGRDAFNHLQPDGHGGHILPLGGGNSVHFDIWSTVTPTNLAIAHIG